MAPGVGGTRNQDCAMAVPAMLEHGRDARGTKLCHLRFEIPTYCPEVATQLVR